MATYLGIQQHNNNLLWKIGLGVIFLILSCHVYALSYELPNNGDNIVGELKIIKITSGDTVYAIARQYDIGVSELLAANPNLAGNLIKAGKQIIIPSAFVLPTAPHSGVVINLAELRLYYYPPYQNLVMTFPIGIGKDGWETPIGETYVLSKEQSPFWYPPESIRSHVLATKGKELPKLVPPGPDNPLGDYAIHLSLIGYLIHGTNQPTSIGMRSSHGCIRMYPEDIEQLYLQVIPGTPVYIVHEPYKLGQYHNELYLEAHQPLTGYVLDTQLALKVSSQFPGRSVQVDWNRIESITKKNLGYPILMGKEI